MTQRYYMAFSASPELVFTAERVLALPSSTANENWEQAFKDYNGLHIPGLINGYLIYPCDSIGLSVGSAKIIHSAAETMSKTATAMTNSLFKKRTNDELIPIIGIVNDAFVEDKYSSTNQHVSGYEIGKELFDKMQRSFEEVRNGRLEEVREELISTMLQTTDVILKKSIQRYVSSLQLSMVSRKVASVAVATCRSANHMVVNKVFKKMDNESMIKLAGLLEDLLVVRELEGQ
mgnify:CR=1 FL=1